MNRRWQAVEMADKLQKIYDRLLSCYGPRHWWPAETPFEVCIGAILTQNTNWGNVEKAIGNLKQARALSPEMLRDIPVAELAEIIRPAGYYNIKSARLKEFVNWLWNCYAGELERMFRTDWQELRRGLLQVKGIGRETADSILLYAGGQPTFVVDAYTVRLFSRLGLVAANADYETVRGLCMNNLPVDPQLFNEYHALIVEHGKAHCRKKPCCRGCRLEDICH